MSAATCSEAPGYCSKRDGCVTADGTDGAETGEELSSGDAPGVVVPIVAGGGVAEVLAVACTSGVEGWALSIRLWRLRPFGAPVLAASAILLSEPSPDDK